MDDVTGWGDLATFADPVTDLDTLPTDPDGSVDDPTPAPDDATPPSDPATEAPALPDPWSIDTARILQERPDVLQAYYDAYYVSGAYKSPAAWMNLVGGTTADAYALHWYENHGRFEGYNQGPTTAQLNISVEKILNDRPDVLEAFNSSMRHGHHSKDWVKEVGGDTPEAYAKYWYQQYGRWEGYAQTDHAAKEAINITKLLSDRPDVVDAYYKAYYSVNNDHNSSAWSDRVGGETLQDYAKFWYVNHGRKEGYTQNPNAAAPALPEPAPPREDPSLDPWNHPALYPDWRPDHQAEPLASVEGEADLAMAAVGQSLDAGDVL